MCPESPVTYRPASQPYVRCRSIYWTVSTCISPFLPPSVGGRAANCSGPREFPRLFQAHHILVGVFDALQTTVTSVPPSSPPTSLFLPYTNFFALSAISQGAITALLGSGSLRPSAFSRRRPSCFNSCWPLTLLSCLPSDDRRAPPPPSQGLQLSTSQNRALRSRLYRLVARTSGPYAPVKRSFRPEAQSQHDRPLLKSWATQRGQRHVAQGVTLTR